MKEYPKHLALLIKCEEKQDCCIQHEWLMDNRKEAVRLSNYLRHHGYVVENKIMRPLGIPMFYVGVPFSTLKKIKP